MKIYKTLALSTLLVASLASCGDYLDKQPSKSSNAPITEADQLFAVYDYISHNYETNNAQALCHDDAGISRELYKSYASGMNNMAPYYMFYSEGIEADSYDYLWNGEYSKIYDANLIINSASEVTGDATEIQEAVANAHFMRAWSFYTLATYYCKPYCEANKNELGVPLRLATDFEEDVSRGTLEQTYAQIFADLKAAENVRQQKVNEDKRWRTSLCAVYAFYSRLYLTTGDYEQALDYTNKALELAPDLFDYNEFKPGTPQTYPAQGDLPEQTLNYCETNSWGANKFLYYKEFIFTRLQRFLNQWYIPSDELVALYDHTNDLRFKNFFVEHGNRRFTALVEAYRYDQFNDGRYVISGLTTAELYLNKAELMVRQGQWQEGLKVLDNLRAHRFVTGTNTSLTASSQSEALKKVLEERRREVPFAQRLADIKRFSCNETADDDVTFTHDLFEVSLTNVDTSKPASVTISGSDPRLAMPISAVEINSSHGAIQQNPFK